MVLIRISNLPQILCPFHQFQIFPLRLRLPKSAPQKAKLVSRMNTPGDLQRRKDKAHAQNRHKPPNNAKPTRNSKSRSMPNGASQVAKSRRKSSLRARLVLFGWVSTLLPLQYFTWTDVKRAEDREAGGEVLSGRDGMGMRVPGRGTGNMMVADGIGRKVGR